MNLSICLHVETSSSRVFNSDSGSAFITVKFSVKYKLHFLLPHKYRRALGAVHHFLETSSSRVFSSDSGSAFITVKFSVKHKLHFLLPHKYRRALGAVHHFKLCRILLFFNSQMYFENSVLFSLLLFLKYAVWLL